MDNAYFFDSYAFFEILKGNPDYEKYNEGISIITTRLNLMELHYWLTLQKGEETADSYYDLFEKHTIGFDSTAIKEASKFRARHKKLKLSYIDCIGYIMAKTRDMKFLTGDKGFIGMENVEYVK